MRATFRSLYLAKWYPLRISRGVHAGSTNLFVFLEQGGHTGIGEMAPGAMTGCETAEEGERILIQFVATLPDECAVQEAYARGRQMNIAPCALAALDIALWDLRAKQCRLPLYKMLGLSRTSVPTSVTIGINPPEVIRERVPEILARTGARYLKIKLGSPEGIEADKASFSATRDAVLAFSTHARPADNPVAGSVGPPVGRPVTHPDGRPVSPLVDRPIGLRVDANGGWSLRDAQRMLPWLRTQGVDYVEQPLHYDNLDELPELYKSRALPIFLDESCRFSTDIPAWAGSVDGVNLKLMKCGGITEALRIVATARAFNLQTMIGCMGESSIAISAGASIGALFDHIDLDSQLNLTNDPAVGAVMVDGVVTPPETPGHGGRMRDEPCPI